MKTANVTQRTQSKFKGKKLQKQNKNKKQEKTRESEDNRVIDRDAAVTDITTGYIYWKLEYCNPAPLSGFGFHNHLLV